METTISVNCRTAPSTNAHIIAVLARGIEVPVRGLSVQGWKPVTCGNRDGWISSRYLAASEQ
jgi:uncharacterized protein YraI